MQAASLVLMVIAFSSLAAMGCASGLAVPIGRCAVAPPIAIGEGPAPKIGNLVGREFDWAYLLTMYQQNADIAGLADFGSHQAADPSIRALSRKMALERVDMNQDLRRWYRVFLNRGMPPLSSARYDELRRMLSNCGRAVFDCEYATVMAGLMRQSMIAADMAIEDAMIPEVRQQARVVHRVNERETQAFERWQETGALG